MRILASILHLGNINFILAEKKDNEDGDTEGCDIQVNHYFFHLKYHLQL